MSYPKMLVTNRSMTTVGEPMKIIFEAVNDRLETVASFRGKVYVFLNNGDSIIRRLNFTAEKKGIMTIEDFIFDKPRLYRIQVKDENGKLLGEGNPVICYSSKPDSLLFWGEIHVHTEYSDGRGTPESNYTYARDVVGLDFCAMADHTRGLSDDNWYKTQVAARQLNEPGRFVTLLGFEWSPPPREYIELTGTAGQDHINAYYMDDTELLIRHSYTREERPTRLYEALRNAKREVITISHHTANANRRRDWTYFDRELEPVVEIYSMWGSSEMRVAEGNTLPIKRSGGTVSNDVKSFVQDALKLGHKLGIIAGSDGHCGFAGRSRMHISGYSPFSDEHLNYPSGLTAVYASELTRKSIFNSLKRGFCYGTTSQRIILQFEINDHQMGEEILLSKNDSIEGKVTVYGTDLIDKVEVIKDATNFMIHKGKGMDEKFTFEDGTSALETHFYYIRVTQKDGAMAWSSPVWVTGK